MIPLNCMHLKWLGDDQPTIFADTSCVLNEFDLQSLINCCIALLEGIFHPHHCDLQTLHSCESSGLHWHADFIVATPMVHKRFPSLQAQFLWFHTKHSMGVLIGFVELGIIFLSRNNVRYCIMNPFYIYYLWGILFQK